MSDVSVGNITRISPSTTPTSTSSFVLFEGTTAGTSISEEHSYTILNSIAIISAGNADVTSESFSTFNGPATFSIFNHPTTEPITSTPTFGVFNPPSSIETGVGSDATTPPLPVSVPADPVSNGPSRQGQAQLTTKIVVETNSNAAPADVTPKETFSAQLTTKTVVETNSNAAPADITPKETFSAQLITKTVVGTNSNAAPPSPSSSSSAQRRNSSRSVRWIGSVIICVLVMGLFT